MAVVATKAAIRESLNRVIFKSDFTSVLDDGSLDGSLRWFCDGSRTMVQEPAGAERWFKNRQWRTFVENLRQEPSLRTCVETFAGDLI